MTDKAFETNPSFHVKRCITGEVEILSLRTLLLVLAKHSFWGGDLALGHNFIRV